MPSAPNPRPTSRYARAAFPALVAAAIAAGYAHVLGAPFQFDDFDWIANNRALAPPLDLGAIWHFRPSRFLPDLTFAMNLAAGAGSPAAMRAVNLAIHFAASLLVGWIAAELAAQMNRAGRATRVDRDDVPPGRLKGEGRASISPAAHRPGPRSLQASLAIQTLAALLFAAHPLATQAVTYVTQRITSLTALVELAAVASFLMARREGANRWWWACWALAILAAFGKEMAAMLPVALVATELILRGVRAGGRAPAWRLLPPFAAVFLVAWLVTAPFGPEGRGYGGFVETADFTRWQYALTQLTVVPRYLALFVWPHGQQLDPWIALRMAPDGAVLAGAALLAGLTVAAFAAMRRAPLVTIGWAWFLVTLAPESSVIPIRDLMNEHRMYLPMAGLAWMVAALAGPLVAERRLARWAAGAALLLLVAATHARNRVWLDDRALWGDSARLSPRSARAQNNYGLALARAGEAEGAERAFRAAIAAEPRHVFARVNLGMLYGSRGRDAEALAVLREAAELAPRDPLVLNNLGTAWWANGDTTRAAACYEGALEADPGAKFPRGNLARMRTGAPAPR